MFGDMMKLWGFFCILGVISINLGLFKVKVQIWKNVFGVAKFQMNPQVKTMNMIPKA